MKLMKHITIALVLCAIPAVTFAQVTNATCETCDHTVSYYKGDGGVVATVDSADKVSWVAVCGGVSRTGELTPDDTGMVALLFAGDTACNAEMGGSFEIGPVMDGGWFWVTDDMNSAVGNLVAKDVLMNDKTTLTSVGSAVTMTEGKGAVYLKETATGRVGILPNILPEPPVPPTDKCGYTGSGTAAAPAKRKMSNCELGDGMAVIIATSTNQITGGTVTIMNGQNIVRPGGTGTLTISADLWGNGTGHFATDAEAGTNGQNFMRGQRALAGTSLRGAARLQGVGFAGRVGTGANAADANGDTHGVSVGSDNNVGTISITAKTAYCSSTANQSLPVSVTATMSDDGDADQVTPHVVRNTAGRAATLNFTVVCPSAAAQLGQELVPDNPFPTD